jgi:uncharacterized protein YbjT (DUF2867 family)
MKVLIFGATGMVGQGVLRECLLAPDVESVVAAGRAKTGKTDPKLREIVHADLTELAPIADQLTGFDACFFCLGVSSAGMKEADYARITYDFPIAVASLLAKTSPSLTFVLVSGAGADSTEKGSTMWARVKGKAENAILALPFQGYVFRPAFITPLHGIKSRTAMYRAIYAGFGFIAPLIKWLVPDIASDTEKIGLAMLNVARKGAPKKLLLTPDINQAAL